MGRPPTFASSGATAAPYSVYLSAPPSGRNSSRLSMQTGPSCARSAKSAACSSFRASTPSRAAISAANPSGGRRLRALGGNPLGVRRLLSEDDDLVEDLLVTLPQLRILQPALVGEGVIRV